MKKTETDQEIIGRLKYKFICETLQSNLRINFNTVKIQVILIKKIIDRRR